MANNQKSFTWLVIALIGVAVLAVSGMVYFYSQSVEAEKEQPAEKIVQDYEKLESSYQEAIQELEKASKGDFSDVDILKQNLSRILNEIQKEKQKVETSREKFEEETAEKRKKRAEQLREKLEMSKEVADQAVTQQLERMKKMKETLEEENKELQKEKSKMEKNLEAVKDNYEQTKAENSQLNSIVEDIEKKVETLEEQGSEKTEELQDLKEKKKEFENRLEANNKVIEQQSGQINELSSELRKVNLDAYFYFHKGNPEKEARIFLTGEGVSKQYKEYFKNKKPAMLVDFELNKDLFEGGLQKVEFRLLNEKGIEVYTMSKVIHQKNLQVKVPADKLKSGKTYSIQLQNGDENLVIGGKYSFKI